MRAKVGWNGVEEPRGYTNDFLRDNMASDTRGFFDCAPPALPPALRSE